MGILLAGLQLYESIRGQPQGLSSNATCMYVSQSFQKEGLVTEAVAPGNRQEGKERGKGHALAVL